MKYLKPRISGFELLDESRRETSSGNILVYEEQAWLGSWDRPRIKYILYSFMIDLTNAHFMPARHCSRPFRRPRCYLQQNSLCVMKLIFTLFILVNLGKNKTKQKNDEAILPFKLSKFYNEHRTFNLARLWLVWGIFLLSLSQAVPFIRRMRTHAPVQILGFCYNL